MNDLSRLSIELAGGPADGALAVIDIPTELGSALAVVEVRGGWYSARPAYARRFMFDGFAQPQSGIVCRVVHVTGLDREGSA